MAEVEPNRQEYIAREEFEARFDRLDREIESLGQKLSQVPTNDTIALTIEASVAKFHRQEKDPRTLIAAGSLLTAIFALAATLVMSQFNDLSSKLSRVDIDMKSRTQYLDEADHRSEQLMIDHQKEAENFFGRLDAWVGSDGEMERLISRVQRLEQWAYDAQNANSVQGDE